MTKEKYPIETKRHSLAHVLAMAVLDLYPDTKLGIGPIIENGFYYDFDFSEVGKQSPGLVNIYETGTHKISANNLLVIEKKMNELLKNDFNFVCEEVAAEKAKKIFGSQPFKLELIKELKSEKQPLMIYKSGEFIDLCAGPHVSSTKDLKSISFKLTKIAGAYWKGDEKNPMLTRIYAVAFENLDDLKNYLKIQEEAEKRDHRKLGKELDLFSLAEEVGGGLPIWHPKGAMVRKIIEDFWKEEHIKRGYQLVYSPHIGKLEIWKKSGHWNFYRENLYSPIDIEGAKYLIKPMNCPFHIFIYQERIRSYRDLPIRYAELGTVYRFEKSGVLHGLTRVRGFTQDDAHIFCRADQLENELASVIKLAEFMMQTFGFKNYKAYLSTKPEKAIGSESVWEKATSALKNALTKTEVKYEIDPGEGVFYGPKIDIKLRDCLGREWQGPTIQVDFNFPTNFEIFYINDAGKKEQPVMIHRTVLGSMERFIGILIEHYAGAFPVWLAPIQVQVLPISEKHEKYAEKIIDELKNNNFRIELSKNETLGKRIREGEIQKIPYLLIVGDKEEKKGTVSVRERGKGDTGAMALDKFLEKILSEQKQRSI